MNTKFFGKFGSTIVIAVVILFSASFANATTSIGMLISPNGGENLRGTQTINWKTADCQTGDTVNLALGYHGGSVANPGTIKTIVTGLSCTSGSYSTWNTNDPSIGDRSDFVIKIERVDSASNIQDTDYSDAYFIIDNTAPEISNYTLDNPIISPNGDGVKDTATIDLKFSEPVNADVNILDSLGTKVRDLYYSSSVTNPDPKTWDGKDNSSNVVADGVYTIQIIITDPAGNTITDTSKTITVDDTAPTMSVTPVSNSYLNGIQTFTFDANDANLAYLEFDIYGPVPYNTAPSRIQTMFAPDSSNPYQHYDKGTGIYTHYTSDELALFTEMGVSATYDSTDQIWTITVDTTKKWTDSSNPWGQSAGSSVWPDGEYNFYIETGDSVGNKWGDMMAPPSYMPYIYNFDNTAPTASVAELVNPITDNNLSQTITVTYNETMDTAVEPTVTITGLATDPYTLTGGAWSTTTYTDDTYTVAQTISDDNEEATATINVSGAQDLAGNTQTPNNAETFAVDTKNPTAAITYDLSRPVKNGDTLEITATFSENMMSAPTIAINTTDVDLSAVAMTIGSNATIWTYDYDVPAGSDGAATVTIAGTDLAGNTNTSATDNTFTIDNTAPTVSTVSSDGEYFNTGTRTITVTFSESLAVAPKIAINTAGSIDNVLATAMTGTTPTDTWTYDYTISQPSSDGTATITLSDGADAAGNVMSDDNSHTFVIDTTDPTITDFDKPVADTVYRTDSILSFTPADTGTAVSCSYSLDGGTTNTSISCANGTAIADAQITGLVEGRNSIEITVTDEAGNSVTDGPVSFVYDTDGILTVDDTPSTNPDFPTIQGAIDAAVTGIDTIQVADGTYPENVNVDKALTIEGANVGIDPNTGSRITESTISSSGAGTVVTITSDGVTIDGFTITNGGVVAGVGIYSNDNSNLTIQNNIITNIGNTGDDVVGRGIEVVSSSSAVDNVSVNNNKIDTITSGKNNGTVSGGTSASGISIGWFTSGTEDVTNLSIKDNVISNIKADTNDWSEGQGAYGILINHGKLNHGQTIGAQILDNTISDLEGLWAHGIGLEGDTPNATITGNTITNLTDHKNGTDAIGIYTEDNPNAGSVQIHNNKLTSMAIGVALNPGTATGVMDATNNWWGDVTGPYNASSNPAGIGVAVGPAINDGFSNYVKFSPFYNSAGMTDLVSVDPIASFDLAFSPNPQVVNSNSTVTVTAKDAGGYTVVNDTTTQIMLIADGGASFGAGTLPLTMEADGDTTTTITNNTPGPVNVNASEWPGGPATGAGTITFTNSDTTGPEITSQTPADDGVGVSIDAVPYLDFNEPLESTTVTSANIQLRKYSDDSVVSATVALVEGGTRVTLTPASPLDYDTQYYFTASANVTDPTGNALTTVWNSSNKEDHEFTTATIEPIVVDDIVAVSSSATADNTYANGWHYIYKITVNTSETDLLVKFTDWIKTGGSGAVPANGNMRLLFNTATGNGLGGSVGAIPESDITDGFGDVESYEIGNDYTDQKFDGNPQVIDISGLDTSTRAGRQIQFDVYTKLPTGTPAGFYETTYGIETQ